MFKGIEFRSLGVQSLPSHYTDGVIRARGNLISKDINIHLGGRFVEMKHVVLSLQHQSITYK
jgi:hypothetical protein